MDDGQRVAEEEDAEVVKEYEAFLGLGFWLCFGGGGGGAGTCSGFVGSGSGSAAGRGVLARFVGVGGFPACFGVFGGGGRGRGTGFRGMTSC